MPLATDLHIDTLLTGLMTGSKNDAYIAKEVLPQIPSDKETGFIADMGEDHYRLDFMARAPGTRARQIDWSVTKQSFAAEEWCLEFPIDRRTRNNADNPFDLDRDGTMVLREKLDLKLEDLVATLLTTVANYAASHTDNTSRDWDTTGDPVTHAGVAMSAIIDDTGMSPTNLYGACSWSVFRYLQQNDEIRKAYINTVPNAVARGALTADAIAATMGLAGIHVGTAIKITSAEGATVTKASVWPANDFLVFARTPNPGIMMPNLGYIIVPQIDGFPGIDTLVDRYEDEAKKSSIIRATWIADELITNNKFGYLFQNVL